MKKLWTLAGEGCFWLTWPFLYLYLFSSKRTRIVVSAGDKILVLKSWLGPDRWSLPGGGVHAKESSRNSAVRELMEETGLRIDSSKLNKLVGKTKVRDHGFSYYIYGYGVRVLEAKNLASNFEIVLSKWIDWKDLLVDTKLTGPSRDLVVTWLKGEHLLD